MNTRGDKIAVLRSTISINIEKNEEKNRALLSFPSPIKKFRINILLAFSPSIFCDEK